MTKINTILETDYPRVTKILSATQDEKAKLNLQRWRKKLEQIHGIDGAELERKKILDNGTALHLSIEKYLGGEPEQTPHPWFQNVLPWVKLIISESPELIIEKRLYCHQYKFQGKPDLVCHHEGKLTIVDWRSSSRMQQRQWVQEKFLQAGAYSLACKEKGMNIEQLLVMVIQERTVQPFYETDVQHFEHEFLKRFQMYKNIQG